MNRREAITSVLAAVVAPKLPLVDAPAEFVDVQFSSAELMVALDEYMRLYMLPAMKSAADNMRDAIYA